MRCLLHAVSSFLSGLIWKCMTQSAACPAGIVQRHAMNICRRDATIKALALSHAALRGAWAEVDSGSSVGTESR